MNAPALAVMRSGVMIAMVVLGIAETCSAQANGDGGLAVPDLARAPFLSSIVEAEEETAPAKLANVITVASFPTRRPAALVPLYVSWTGLQIADGLATLHGAGRNATEANPLMRGIASTPVAMWSVKAASTFATVYTAECLWRQGHRKGAVVVMIISNAVLTAVAAHNASVLRDAR